MTRDAPPTRDQPPIDTSILVSRAQAGDRAALEGLFNRFTKFLRPAVARRVDSLLLQREGVDDLVESCLGEALRSFPKYRKIDGTSVFGWLLTILVRKLSDKRAFHYAQKRSPDAETAAPSDMDSLAASRSRTPSQVAAGRESIGRLWSVIESLDDEDRTIVACTSFGRVGNRELGEILGCSEDAARMRATRVMRRIELMYVGHHGKLT